MKSKKFTKAEVNNAVKIFKECVSYLDTEIKVDNSGYYFVTLEIAEVNNFSAKLGSNLIERVVDFTRAYETMGKSLYFIIEVVENKPIIFLHFQIK